MKFPQIPFFSQNKKIEEKFKKKLKAKVFFFDQRSFRIVNNNKSLNLRGW